MGVAGWPAGASRARDEVPAAPESGAVWPNDTERPVGSRLNGLPKDLASTTSRDPSWQGSEIIEGDVAERVAELKQREGRELQIHGSGRAATAGTPDALT